MVFSPSLIVLSQYQSHSGGFIVAKYKLLGSVQV